MFGVMFGVMLGAGPERSRSSVSARARSRRPAGYRVRGCAIALSERAHCVVVGSTQPGTVAIMADDNRTALTDCTRGTIYRLRSRNLAGGVFNGRDGFIGIREKFGDRYLFTEYHWDTGAPYGTAVPYEAVGSVPDGVEVVERLHSRCSNCEGLSFYVPWADGETGNGYPGRWCHVDEQDQPIETDCEKVSSYAPSNSALFDVLEAAETATATR